MARKLTKTQVDEWTVWNYTKLKSDELVESLQRAASKPPILHSMPAVRKGSVGKVSLAFKVATKKELDPAFHGLNPVSFFKTLERLRKRKAPLEIPLAVIHNNRTKERHIVTLWHEGHMEASDFFNSEKISRKVKEKAAIELARKIGALHREGITHGHLTNFYAPSRLNNILISPTGRVRIIDYSALPMKVNPSLVEINAPYMVRSALEGSVSLLDIDGYMEYPDRLTTRLVHEYEKARTK